MDEKKMEGRIDVVNEVMLKHDECTCSVNWMRDRSY
jgi:hypothetical protein